MAESKEAGKLIVNPGKPLLLAAYALASFPLRTIGYAFEQGITVVMKNAEDARVFAKRFCVSEQWAKKVDDSGSCKKTPWNYQAGVLLLTHGISQKHAENFLKAKEFQPIVVTGGFFPSWLMDESYLFPMDDEELEMVCNSDFQVLIDDFSTYLVKNIKVLCHTIEVNSLVNGAYSGDYEDLWKSFTAVNLLLTDYVKDTYGEETAAAFYSDLRGVINDMLDFLDRFDHEEGMHYLTYNAILSYERIHEDVLLCNINEVDGKASEAIRSKRAVLYDKDNLYLPYTLFDKACRPIMLSVSAPQLKEELTRYGILRGGEGHFTAKKQVTNIYGAIQRQQMLWMRRYGTANMEFETVSDESIERNLPIPVQELFKTDYDMEAPIVDGLIYPGMFLLAGAPKTGKSFMVLQIANHVSSGKALWNHKVHQGTVLYFSLEDDDRRIRKRLEKMLDGDVSGNLYIQTAIEGCDIADVIAQFITDHSDTRMIIIDTLQKIRGGSASSYSKDYSFIEGLKSICSEHGICLMLVHHTRKAKGKSAFEEISGSTGLFGAADGALVLTRDGSTDKAILSVAGRDVEHQEVRLFFDSSRCLWTLEEGIT